MKLLSIAALILAFLPVSQGSTGIIEGIVLRKDSRAALSGVRIGIEEGFPSRTLRTPFFTDTLTDGGGQFTIRNVPAGEFDIRASLQGYLGQAHAKIMVMAGQRTQVTLELSPGSTIRGRVTDSEEHAVASVRVEILQQYTDELGRRHWVPEDRPAPPTVMASITSLTSRRVRTTSEQLKRIRQGRKSRTESSRYEKPSTFRERQIRK